MLETKDKIFNYSIFFIIFLGIIARVLFYSYNRPFWLDECALALNIVQSNNYFISLDYNQIAPSLFMYLSKLMYYIFPDKELGLRFLPLLFSISSIFVFYAISKKFLIKKTAVLIALLLFCFTYPLIYYSQEFKPYSADVFFFLLILLSYYYLENVKTAKQIAVLSILYAFALHISFASFFAEFTIFLTLLIFNRKQFCNIIYIFIPVILSAIYFYIFKRATIDTGFFQNYWNFGFFDNNINNNFSLFNQFSWFIFQNKLIMTLLFIISCFIALIKDFKNKNLYLYLFPIVIAIILSYLKIYPFHSRLILFIVPCVIIFIVKWTDYINLKNKYIYLLITVIFSAFIMFPILQNDYKKIIKKEYRLEDMQSLLKIANKLAKPDDIFIIPRNNKWLYEYYKQYVPVKNLTVITPIRSEDDNFTEHLESYPKGKVYYMFIAHSSINNIKKQKNFQKIYDWAKDKEYFWCKRDNKNNTLFRYKL